MCSRGILSTSAIGAVLVAGCAPISHTSSFNDHLLSQRDERSKPTVSELIASTEMTPDGFHVRASQKLTCETWKADVISRSKVQQNSVNKVVLTMELLLAIGGLGFGGFVTHDATSAATDADILFAPDLKKDQQKYMGIGALVVGGGFAIAAIFDLARSIDHESSATRIEQKHPGTEQAVACGTRPADGVLIGVRTPSTIRPVTIGRVDANGDLMVQWMAMPSELFEGHDVVGKAELVADNDKVVSVIDLSPGVTAHAEAAWALIVDAGTPEDFAKYHVRYPTQHAQEAVDRTAMPSQDKIDAMLLAAQQAIAARDLVASRAAVAALKNRVPKDVYEGYQRSLSDLEKAASIELSMTQATKAVTHAEAKDADATVVLDAAMAIRSARDIGGEEKALAALEKRLDKASTKVITEMLKAAQGLSAVDAENKLAEAKKIAPKSKQVDAAIERNHQRIATGAATDAGKLAKDGKFDDARARLDQAMMLTGKRPELDRARQSVDAAEKQQAKTAEAKEAAAQREADRLAKIEADRAAKEDAKRQKEQAVKDAADAKKRQAEEAAAQKAAAAAAAAAQKAAATAAAAAKVEQEKKAKEEAARNKAAADAAAAKAAEEDKKVPKLMEYRLPASLATQDVLAKVSVAKCKPTLSDIKARAPDCYTCQPEPMRMLVMDCGAVRLELVKAKERVWARCTGESCGECKTMVGNAMATFKAGKETPTEVTTCQGPPAAGAKK